LVRYESWKLIYFGVKKSKVNVMRYKKQVAVDHQTERNSDACCVRQLRWVFPRLMLLSTAGFFNAWSFRQLQKNIAGAGYDILTSAGFF